MDSPTTVSPTNRPRWFRLVAALGLATAGFLVTGWVSSPPAADVAPLADFREPAPLPEDDIEVIIVQADRVAPTRVVIQAPAPDVVVEPLARPSLDT